ncbi:hypothetical protein EHV15_35260 [Paenibacillus oralis]|uniref:Uncharacterized protein n=1 Tax=Paenibacillus oralis TaxID=2490856 RepID=A0A3P3TBD2_9BACL|nr:hypothetical protein [Paenibacillus oralis]RRJ54834.1 hypothetical protein EHV15_35260 [Paenibacillus oralis]
MMVNQFYEEHKRERRYLNRNPYNCKFVKESPNGARLYTMGFWIFKVSVIVARENGLWHLSLSGNRRKPSPRQVFIALSELIPLEVKMEVRNGVGLDPYCIHLFQVEGTYIEAIKWMENRGYELNLHEGYGWYKGPVCIAFAYLEENKNWTLKDFIDFVIRQENKHFEGSN